MEHRTDFSVRDQEAAIAERNDLVAAFNRLLNDPARDQWIFKTAVERAQSVPVSAFILGQGHKRGMLRLAAEYLPDDVLFVWVTPPQMWLWRTVLVILGWFLLAGAIAVLAFLASGR